MSFAQYMVLKKGPLPLCLFTLDQKNGPFVSHMLHKNSTSRMQFEFFIFSGNLLLRESPFHIVNCLKFFDFTLFFVHTLKLLKGPLIFFALFVLYFEKHMTCYGACGSRVDHQLLNKSMQNLSAQFSKRGPAISLKKGGPRRQPCSPSLTSTTAVNYTQTEALMASFYNTPM